MNHGEEDIQRLTARLAADPDSLAFLPLGEVLRARGQLDAALSVAHRGAARYPQLADAHDLVARIRSDRGEGDQAFDAWTEALRLDPRHVGALRGLAFLAFRIGDLARAERHLAAALEAAPADAALRQALGRVRDQRARDTGAEAEAPRGPASDDSGTLLLDQQGRHLAGMLLRGDAEDVSETVAAELAGVSQEASRTARLLGLGQWKGLACSCPDAHLHLVAPTPEALLLAVSDSVTPVGRLALRAERAAAAARRWLERFA